MFFRKPFQKNLQLWRLICPKGAEQVAATVCNEVAFCQSKSGALNLYREGKGEKIYLHSQDDPITEASQWFADQSLRNINLIFVYGVGLGYYYEAAKKWLKQDEEHRRLVFIEDNPQVIHRFLESDKASELLSDKQVGLYLVDIEEENPSLPGLGTYIYDYSGIPGFMVSSLPSYTAYLPEYRARIGFYMNMYRLSVTEFWGHGLSICRNFFLNYLELPEAYSVDNMLGKFKNIPAIICGAGPSLDKNIDVLSTLSDRAIIFAGGTALNALNAKNVMPHFGVGIDPNAAQFTRLVMNHAYETPFLYRNRMLHEALQMVHGDKLYVTGSIGYGIAEWMEKQLGIKRDALAEGFNVLNFSVELAHAMGCSPIICVGVDLAYSQQNSYASGIISHPLHNRQEDFRTKHIEEELLCKNDIYGNPVFTLWKWIAESMWYSRFGKSHPGTTLINATEGGIGFPDIPNMTLAEVKEKFLAKQYDLHSLIQGEIQNSPMPQNVTEERIEKLLEQFSDGLYTCGQYCHKVAANLVRRCSQDKQKKEEDNTLAAKVAEEEKKLFEEPTYKALLKSFDEAQRSRQALERKRLELDKKRVSAKELRCKKLILDIKRYDSLKQTAFLNAEQIRKMLKDYSTRKTLIDNWALEAEQTYFTMLKEEYPIPSPRKEDIYSFDNHLLTITDPELDLKYKESFIPSESDIERLYYPNSAVKMEQFYFQGSLHGPSTFYREDGGILSRAWFWHGKRVGKMWTYYPTGAVHSLQRYKEGVQHGMQEFFYPNSLPRSSFSCIHGRLDGAVNLFHSQGQLARQLHFKDGLRYGREQIWDECSQLRIEAHYVADKPTKKARSWHANGVLAKEVTYDDNLKRCLVQEWDASGKLLKQNKAEDFFDRLNSIMGKATDSFTDVYDKLFQLVPHINQKSTSQENVAASSESPPPSNNLSLAMKNLQKELEKLQNIDSRLKQATTFIDDNPKEDLWKNPEIRKHLEKNLGQLGTQIQDNSQTLQEEFQRLLNTFLKKPKNDDPKQD